jgi:hypothetical protein
VNVIKGAIGLAKCAAQHANLEIDRAEEEKRLQRIEICRTCPLATKRDEKLTTWSRCTDCGCLIVCKTTIDSEKCPKGKW